MKKIILLMGVGAAAAFLLMAQDVIIKLEKGERPIIALPDLRGAGDAQKYMDAFNQTLWSDIEQSGLFKMGPKGLYPSQVPQRPEDFRQSSATPQRGATTMPSGGGYWLSDWSGPPVGATYLALGYTAVQADQLVLRGWLYNVTQRDLTNAQVFGKTYLGTIDENGARKIAHDFAADILQQFGAQSLSNSKIYYVSGRGKGISEIWSMDWDGGNQKAITNYRSISINPAVSPDNTKVAFTSYARGNPAIFVHSLETGRRLPFYNQVAPMAATPDFTPDGKRIVYALSIGGYLQICAANTEGGDLRRISQVRAIEVEPKVNPKTGSEIVFVSGRSGPQQIFKMNMDGLNVERLTTGEGQASNPAWMPDGQHIAFAWTKGFAPGNFNIFVMDVATRRYEQLTHGAGRNENPSWAPDGRHLVFSSNRSGSEQIWTMLADGTQLKQLTTQGQNTRPVWSR